MVSRRTKISNGIGGAEVKTRGKRSFSGAALVRKTKKLFLVVIGSKQQDGSLLLPLSEVAHANIVFVKNILI